MGCLRPLAYGKDQLKSRARYDIRHSGLSD